MLQQFRPWHNPGCLQHLHTASRQHTREEASFAHTKQTAEKASCTCQLSACTFQKPRCAPTPDEPLANTRCPPVHQQLPTLSQSAPACLSRADSVVLSAAIQQELTPTGHNQTQACQLRQARHTCRHVQQHRTRSHPMQTPSQQGKVIQLCTGRAPLGPQLMSTPTSHTTRRQQSDGHVRVCVNGLSVNIQQAHTG